MRQSDREFDYLKIKLASPTRIKQWGQRPLPNGQIIGEVKKAETINYRTFKPEMNGLFCERIFGPNKNLECACGKYKRVQYEGLICDRCGVEVTESRVRRHRMGCVHLVYPVVHIWYITSRPNYIALLLEVEQNEQKLNTGKERYELKEDWEILKPLSYSQVENKDERIQTLKLASLAYFIANNELEFYLLHCQFKSYRISRLKQKSYFFNTLSPRKIFAKIPTTIIGAVTIKNELQQLNLRAEVFRTRQFITYSSTVLAKKYPEYLESQWYRKWEHQRIYKLRAQAIQRIRILENLIATQSNPAWMILSILPVIPPALRPMIQLEGGRFATSDLNELYRRVITRNNRLLRLLEIDAPQLIVRNEKRMLQEAVDTLIDNGKRGKIVLGANNRPLKSLSDIIKGKHGRFRQNLLGKRVDYSGRSVIVVGPSLKLNQCGLPYEMAIELFQPFIICQLIKRGLANNIKIAKNLIQQNKPLVNPVLEQILLTHPIFLNRAPTLHRLGIQAFEPIVVQGRAIKLHPLVCSAFNADFDGDQMAVHIPLSLEAQAECYTLMLAPYNFLSPANGEPIVTPSQDMVLGCYYLTVNNVKNLLGANHYFANLEDVLLAYNQQQIELHASIWVRYDKPLDNLTNLIKSTTLSDKSFIEHYDNLQIRKDKDKTVIVKYVQTTTGRVIFNYTIQKTLNLL